MLRRFSISIALALGLWLSPTTSLAQEHRFHHLQGGRISGVFFLDDDLGWTAEDGARVRWTIDGGATWEYGETQDFREELTDVYFVTEFDGWAVSGGGHVLISDDGGANWTLQTSSPLQDALDPPGDARLNTIFMFNTSDGWVAGDNGAVYVTNNGGLDWNPADNLPEEFTDALDDPFDPYKIRFFDSNVGLMATEYGYVYRTTNGGASWAPIQVDSEASPCPSYPGSHPNLELWDFDFDGASNGWIVGGVGLQNGYIFRTTNGGVSWTQSRCFSVPPSEVCGPPTIYAVAALDWPLAVAGGYASTTFVLDSGLPPFDVCGCDEAPASGPCSTSGDFWSQEYVQDGFDPPVFAAARIDDGKACLTGAFGFIRLVDATSITEVANEHFCRLEGGDFISDSTGCVVGQGHLIKRTTDGGVSWTTVYPTGTPSPNDWGRDIAFSSSGQYGVAVGDNGFTAYSSDSGVTWDLNTLNTTNFQAVGFIPGGDDVLIGGVGGILKKSTNGGVSWSSSISVGTSETITAIAFADASVGYLVGTGGAAYKTTDAGSTWSAVSLSPSSSTDFYGVATWGDGTPAVAVGAEGKVFGKTGSQFVQLNLGGMAVDSTLTDVEVFPDGSDVHIRICGLDGTMLFGDGPTSSITWTHPKSQTNEHHTALSFVSADEGFGIGRAFVITKYE